MAQSARRLSTWYRAKKRPVRIALALAVLALICSLYVGVRGLALHSADSMTITIFQQNFTGGNTFVYAHSFGPALAQEAQGILNDPSLAQPHLSVLGFGATYGGHRAYYGPPWRYTLDFKWHGFVIESASMTDNGGVETYSISALGVPDPRTFAFDGAKMQSLIRQLAQDSHVAIPQSPYYSPQPVAGS